MDIAQVFEQISRKRVVLPLATKRARSLGAIGDKDEVAVTIQAIHPRDYLALGETPSWLFDPEERKKIKPEELAQKNAIGIKWLEELFSLGIVGPPLVIEGKPDRSKGEIGMFDILPDRESLIIELLVFSGLIATEDGFGGPFRDADKQSGGKDALGSGAGVPHEAV